MNRLIGGVAVAVEDLGAGTPVLFLHGFQIDHRSLLHTLGPVFEQRTGYRRIHVDLPGFGASPAAPAIASSDAMVEFVMSLIDEMVGTERFLLVGESWGGYLARGVVARRPAQVTGLALLYPMVVPAHAERDVPEHRTLAEAPGVLDDALLLDAETYRGDAVVIHQGSWDYYRQTILPALAAGDRTTIEKVAAAYAFTTDPESGHEPYPGPSLILTGRQDASVGYRDAFGIVERFPHATFVALDEAGHNLMAERPQVATSLVNDWLDRVERIEGRSQPVRPEGR